MIKLAETEAIIFVCIASKTFKLADDNKEKAEKNKGEIHDS